MESRTEIVHVLLDGARRSGLALREDSAVLDDTGWDFLVVRVQGQDGTPWILRRARRTDMAGSIEAERGVLSRVAPRLPVEVPRWVLAGPDLIAYPALPGEPAASEDAGSHELHWRIDRANPPGPYLDGLAEVMALLHGMSVQEFRGTGIPVRDPDAVREAFRERLEVGRSDLAMNPGWWKRGQRWLDDDRLWSPRCVLIH